MTSALEIQIDGNHYKKMNMQPLELVYLLNASPVFCKLAKYITREKNDRKINLQKALHCISLEKEFFINGHWNYNYLNDDSKLVEILNKFTSDSNVYHALYALYYNKYDLSSYFVNKIIEEEGL